jgi:large conductance mechanosensitive channel
VLTALFAFLVIAAVVYFLVVLPYNKLQERRARGKEEAFTVPAEDIALLIEIRDLLANGSRPTSGTGL